MTVQHGLLRGIETVFELEEGELLSEPTPREDCRRSVLFYEASEGGAGVLSSLAIDRRAPERRPAALRSCTSTLRPTSPT